MDKPIRVLNLLTLMNIGGAQSVVMNYYRAIDRSVIQFDFMVHRPERGVYDDEIEAMGGRIYRMCPIYPQNFYKYKRMLRDFFTKHSYDIIHNHMSELGYFAFKEASGHGAVRICSAHNSNALWDVKRLFREYFKHGIRRYADEMLACSNYAGLWLYGRENRNRYTIMKNAIDTQRFRFSEDLRSKIRASLGVSIEAIIVGHVGNYSQQKNPNFLLSVFKEIKNRNKNAVLLQVGMLKKQIAEKVNRMGLSGSVICTGPIENVAEMYQAMDVVLFPSLYEGLPVTIIEAQAAGLPCVISDRIDPMIKITDLVEQVSLKRGYIEWADKVLNSCKHSRLDMTFYEGIQGFDVKNCSKWLEEYYISKYNKGKNR